MNEFMKTFSLEGKVAVISGGAGFYGKQLVRALAMAGARVYMASRNKEKNEEYANELRAEGYQVFVETLDLASEESINALCNTIYEKEGHVDVLVNNSVLRTMSGYHDTAENWELSMKVNATGLFLISRAFGDRMCEAGKGSIINIGSYMGMVGPNYTLYKEAGMNPDGVAPDYFFHKGGMTNYTRYLAANYGKFGVRCNVIQPGGYQANPNPDNPFVQRYNEATFLGRFANDTDLMGALVFLASDASAYITGAELPVDGGLTAK